MKSITRKLLIVLLALAIVASTFALVACKTDSNVYTVKVVGIDGKPYTQALVQPCEVGSDGETTTCYNGVATDANGVAKLEIGKHITNKDADYMEIHLMGLPVYLTYDAPRMHKGEEVTIQLKKNLSTPKSGTGAGGYEEDPILGNVTLNVTDPYIVGRGAYALKFTSAEQLIYYAFQSKVTGIYKVYSVGDVDACLTQILGTRDTTVYAPGEDEDEFRSNNVSSTDKNFSYEFEVTTADINQGQGTAEIIFEIALENPAHVNKEAIICFEYVDEYEDPSDEVENVEPSKPLTSYANQDGAYIDLDLDGSMTCVKDSDGYYHVNDEDGALVVATLGKDNVKPRGLELNFLEIFEQGHSFTFTVGGVQKNYYSLVKAYSDASNDEGRYPLTDELIDFFTLYISAVCPPDWFDTHNLETPAEGKEWMVWCGYYQASNSAGTEDDPIMLTGEQITVNVPQGGEKFYFLSPFTTTTVNLSSDSTNVKLESYNMYFSEIVETNESDSDGFACSIEVGMFSYYIFKFSTKDGQAATYDVSVELEEEAQPDGSSDHPFEIYGMGTVYGETTELDFEDKAVPVHYTYTVEFDIDTLYFYLGDNTQILEVTVIGADEIPVSKSFDQVANGLSVNEGDVINIMASTVDGIGYFEFSIYSAVLGSIDNPYYLTDGTVTVPASGEVYYSVSSFMPAKITVKSTSANVKLLAYSSSSNETPTPILSTSDGFTHTVTLEAMDMFYFVFSTKDGQADSYDIEVETEYIIPKGSWDNPIEIEELGEQNGETTETNWMGEAEPVYYSYEVTSADEIITIVAGANTVIIEVDCVDVANETGNYYYDGEWENGITVSAGVVITIIVVTADGSIGAINFTITNQAANAD